MGNMIDNVINWFSPTAGLKRQQARMAQDAIRAYDIASRGRRNEGWNRPHTTGAEEVSRAVQLGAAGAQELGRNNPLASRIKRVWANNAVGAGITLDVSGAAKTKNKKFQTTWDEWAENTWCDFEGHYNLYGLQWLWVSNLVEAGGVFIRRHRNAAMKFPLQLQTLEQSQLDRAKSGENIVDGVQFTKQGQIEGYWFMTETTAKQMRNLRPESKFYKADEIIHLFRKDRIGQHLGMTWLDNSATLLRDYDTYKDAKLMQQQIAALFALFIEDADQNMGLSKGTSDKVDELEPGMIEYVRAGSKPYTISPPKADNSNAFDVGLKRDMAAGAGITYEQLTGDYSLVNFASGRMGRTEFYNGLDFVQQMLMKPVMNKIFGWFTDLYKIKNGGGEFEADWTFPPRAAVNPQEEFDVLMSKVRHGMMSPTKAAKILGERLEKVIEQWGKDKETFGELPFDIDPSVYAATGNQLNTDDAASANAESGEPGETTADGNAAPESDDNEDEEDDV